MARKDIHPKTQAVSYIMLDGSIALIPSCYTRSEKFILEVDIFNHVAWRSDKQYVNENVGNVAKFRQKFNMSADTLSNIMKKPE